jgi:predicted PurR-regulated permease PerM
MAQMARLVSLLLMGAVIVILGLTFFQVVAPFLMPLFLAGVFAILCQPIYRRFLVWTKNRNGLSAGLTTAVALALILALVFCTYRATRQLYSLAQDAVRDSNWTELLHSVQNSAPVEGLIRRYEELNEEEVDRAKLQHELQAKLKEGAVSLAQKTLGSAGPTLSFLGSAVSLIVGFLTFVIAVFYFLADGPALITATEKLIPVHRDYKRHLLLQFDQAVRAVVSATFAAALGQGIATGIGMQIAGFQHFFVVTILATLTALVPLLGTWLIWGPYAVWLAYTDHWGWAIFLTLYGAVFVGLLDNAIRTYVLHSNVKLHPLLAFVSVLGGIEVMGLWGVFIGPIVASCLHALIKIFNAELLAYSEQQQARSTLDPDLAVLVLPAGDEPGILKHRVPTTQVPGGPEPPSGAGVTATPGQPVDGPSCPSPSTSPGSAVPTAKAR